MTRFNPIAAPRNKQIVHHESTHHFGNPSLTKFSGRNTKGDTIQVSSNHKEAQRLQYLDTEIAKSLEQLEAKFNFKKFKEATPQTQVYRLREKIKKQEALQVRLMNAIAVQGGKMSKEEDDDEWEKLEEHQAKLEDKESNALENIGLLRHHRWLLEQRYGIKDTEEPEY